MKLPTFLVGGAPRAGTTLLREILAAHPDVWMARPARPEPKFFLVDEEYAKGLAYYAERWFRDADRPAVGEKSSNYLESPAAAERVRASLPDARVVFCLRDPVERAYSNWLWSRRNGLETLPFDEAVALEAEREAAYAPAHRFSRPFSYVSRGMYAGLLAPWIAALGHERIHVVFLEDLAARPPDALAPVLRFIGADPGRQPPWDASRLVNSARDGAEPLDPALARRLRGVYTASDAALRDLTGRPRLPWDATA